VGLQRVIVPAGRTGNIVLIDPDTLELTAVGGFPSFSSFDNGDQQGVESADEGDGIIFANDRATRSLRVVDARAQTMIGTVKLDDTEPDYVRYVASRREVWITQPA
jgi:hypothetical protein